MKMEPRQDFTPHETGRYARNALLAQVGWEGQARWRAGRVLVVGAGGIGAAALLYLAAAGVGRLGLADGDAVELSNLQRQILYRSADLGRRKAAAAAESLAGLNPLCGVETFDLRLNRANVGEVVQGFEVVLDASDNFPTRFVVAECCWQYKIPLVSAAATGWHGQLLVAAPGAGESLLPLSGAGDAAGCGRACLQRSGHPGGGGRDHGLPAGGGSLETAFGPGIGPEPPASGL